MTTDRTSKTKARQGLTLPTRAWNWRRRRLPGADFATLAVVEEAYIAGARWAMRRAERER